MDANVACKCCMQDGCCYSEGSNSRDVEAAKQSECGFGGCSQDKSECCDSFTTMNSDSNFFFYLTRKFIGYACMSSYETRNLWWCLSLIFILVVPIIFCIDLICATMIIIFFIVYSLRFVLIFLIQLLSIGNDD